MKGKKLIVVGDVGVDEYVNGQVRRISPEAPVPILEVQNEEIRLGLATNVAQNIVSLGGECFLVSVVGVDEGAERLRKLLKAARVGESHLIEDSSRPTTRKLRVMSEHHHLVRVDYEKRKFISDEVAAQILKKVKELLPICDGLILQDYAKGVLRKDLIQDLISLAHKAGKKVTVDPNKTTPIDYFYGSDLMTPNYDEAVALSGLPVDDLRGVSDSLAEVGAALLSKTGAKQLVITRGKDGMSLFEEGGSVRVPTFAREVFDVTGAGDTVIAALSLAWAGGLSLKDSCLIANHAAGVVVGKIGCVPCTTEELETSIRGES
jgi:rfaE bifunctional protein kinase chain/domain